MYMYNNNNTIKSAMPVKRNSSGSNLRLDIAGSNMTNIDVDDLYSIEPSLLSDDIWNKFELDIIHTLGDDIMENLFNEFEVDSFKLSSLFGDELCEIRNHDCMWAGHCGSKEHPADQEPKQHIIIPHKLSFAHNNHKSTTAAANNTLSHAPALGARPTPSIPIPAGRSLLLKTQPTAAAPAINTSTTNGPGKTGATGMLPPSPVIVGPLVPSPDSPPMSDDEEVKAKTTTLQLLHDAISECDIEDDSDLYEYLEEDPDPEELLSAEEPMEEATPHPVMPRQTSLAPFTSDHCYHKDKNASMRNLGIETPSDSEEEIDVVSIGEKQNTLTTKGAGLACSTLPNNPTIRDKQQIQRTMASAISKNGIKTLLPRKAGGGSSAGSDLSASSTSGTLSSRSPPKRRSVESSRGMKRSKHRSPAHSPYKKRSSGSGMYSSMLTAASSDSDEPEPSEKRSLHNNMERQRRIDLRNAFEDLRLLVPEVSKRDKAAKVVILREAARYCDQLGDVSDGMHRQVDDLRRQQERLRARVSQLRRTLAAKHR